ncbi:MAG: hypothetical protein C5B50_01900 [Verrucomicrobia bacterium]|nr:MAG: hypothetical protein C5B50_01900 [Verrucomicrobiota bacterium]
MPDNSFERSAEQLAAFQKIWMESFSKMMQAGFAFGPNSPPPELLRQMRSGIFEALAKTWEDYMRSPQFLQGMKQWMDGAVAFRKMTNDFMGKVRNEMQSPSRDDIDHVMIAVRHMEKRLLDRIEELAGRVDDLNAILANGQVKKRPAAPRNRAARVGARRAASKRAAQPAVQ